MLAADLTNEELAVLSKKDEEALNRLISQNEGFVVFMASRFLSRKGFHDHIRTGMIEDYKQICRIAISRAVKNYKAGSAARFMTYAGKIMYHDMTKQLAKDLPYRENIIDTIPEEEDTLVEECDEEYGDAYDNIFENRKARDLEDILPSLRWTYSKLKEEDDRDQREEDAFVRLGSYTILLKQIAEPDPKETEEKSEPKKKKYKGVYIKEKETDNSWKYPIYHKALNNLQIKAMLTELLDKNCDEAQREYLVYRYGLKSMEPQKLKDAAEHYNLTLSSAKKIEKAGFACLRTGLRRRKLL